MARFSLPAAGEYRDAGRDSPRRVTLHALMSSYRAPFWLQGGDMQTIYASALMPRPRVAYRRERWDTPDGDFIDLDLGQRSRQTMVSSETTTQALKAPCRPPARPCHQPPQRVHCGVSCLPSPLSCSFRFSIIATGIQSHPRRLKYK